MSDPLMDEPPKVKQHSTLDDASGKPVAKDNKQPALVPELDPSRIAGETLEQLGAATADIHVSQTPAAEQSSGRSAFLVGFGILISRIVGLIRQRVFAYYFGRSGVGDAFTAAFRIPNFLQNVFGEGALSASFIPVYAKLLALHDEKEAARVANAIFTLLALITSIIVLLGVLFT